jgi:hypothetical protein
MFIHFDFENYVPNYMGKMDKEKKIYLYRRVIPPGKFNYFFTIKDQHYSHA